jgi:hypothetical protein
VTVGEISPADQAAHLRRLEDRFGIPAVSVLDPDGPSKLIDAVLAAYAPPPGVN